MALFDNGTNKQGLIVYGGENSTDYGIVVRESPAFERPVRKQTIYNIPGRNGSVLFQEDAWEDVTRTYRVWLAEEITDDGLGNKSGYLVERVDAFEAMLNSKKGYQRLSDNFEPDTFRLAYYSGGDNFTNKMTQYGEASIRFICRPERFLVSGEIPVDVTNTLEIENPTKFNAKPLIHIEGSGTVTVSIGGKTITANITDYINIDCDTMNAYRLDDENMNSYISGSFPVILPETNVITTTGTITNLTITPRFYTI